MLTPPPSLVWAVRDRPGDDDSRSSAALRFGIANGIITPTQIPPTPSPTPNPNPNPTPNPSPTRASTPAPQLPSHSFLDNLPDAFPDAIFHYGRFGAVSVFFAIAGFYSWSKLRRVGSRAFWNERSRKLGGLLLRAGITVLPLTYLIWSWGWVTRGWITPDQIWRFNIPTFMKRGCAGPAHLWFLVALLLITGILAIAASTGTRRAPQPPASPRPIALPSLARAVLLFAACSAVAAIAMAADPRITIDFRNTLLPRSSSLLAFVAPFALGIGLASSADITRHAARLRWPALFASHLTFIWWIATADFSTLDPRSLSITERIAPAAFMLLLALSALGFALTHHAPARSTPDPALPSSQEPPRTSTLAHALSPLCMPIYILHLPVVAAAQVALHGTALHPLIKLAIVAAAGVVVPILIATAHRALNPRSRPAPIPAARSLRSRDEST